MHFIEEVFGEGCDLYKDVLCCSNDATKAELRKAYYRTALKYHPDKNSSKDASTKFQAVTCAYQLLQSSDFRDEYNKTGKLPSNNDDDYYDEDDNKAGVDVWKQYFTNLFGKITGSKIDEFASKYKCSDEECKDVLKEFIARKGDLVKMLEYVMCSEARDAIRWVEDYIKPAIESEEPTVSNRKKTVKGGGLAQYKETMEKSLLKIQKLVEKQDKKEPSARGGVNKESLLKNKDVMSDEEGNEEDNDNPEIEEEDEPDTESENDDSSQGQSSRRLSRSSKTSKSKDKVFNKVKKTQAKLKKGSKSTSNSTRSTLSDLEQQIQSRAKNASGGFSVAKLGARYGCVMNDEEDPIGNDAEFAKIQQKLLKKGSKKKERS